MRAKIARTGRVQSWLDEPSHRLPVSCTIVVPEDNMESIQDSWTFASYALRHGAGVAVHLSNLRPKGSDNGRTKQIKCRTFLNTRNISRLFYIFFNRLDLTKFKGGYKLNNRFNRLSVGPSKAFC